MSLHYAPYVVQKRISTIGIPVYDVVGRAHHDDTPWWLWICLPPFSTVLAVMQFSMRMEQVVAGTYDDLDKARDVCINLTMAAGRPVVVYDPSVASQANPVTLDPCVR